MTSAHSNQHTAKNVTSSSATSSQNHEIDSDSDSDSGVLAKSDSQDDTFASSCSYINPFVHRLEIDNRFDIAKIYVLSVLLLPIRVVGCVISILGAYVFACIGLWGLSDVDLQTKPITGWRKHVQRITAKAMRMVYASGSFHYITIKGKQASPKEAPILVVAPHSSYVDSIVVVASGPQSIVAKRETQDIPVIGKIINFAQPIYVQREDPNSRQNTIKEIVARARSNDEWPQVVIFAEGTCTNRKSLIKFKPGAFYAGVPVQPVLLKYPNRYDTCTWTWDGPGVLHLLWFTMASFYTHCEVEYLPVYIPNGEEKSDATLFGANVRQVMARALNVPTSEYSFEDVILMTRARDTKIPFPGDIIEIEHTIHQMGLFDTNRDAILAADYLTISNSEKIDIVTFAELLQIDMKNAYLNHLFSLLDHHSIGVISLKSFILCFLFCRYKNDEAINFLRAIGKIYSESSHNISREEFSKIIRHAPKIPKEKHDSLFYAIDETNKTYITFDDFENYTKNLPQYNHLYMKREHLRRTFKNVDKKSILNKY